MANPEVVGINRQDFGDRADAELNTGIVYCFRIPDPDIILQ
jgi:hypothetical protein